MRRKLIALDLDGTTLNDQSQISNRTRLVLGELARLDHVILIATGRPYRNSKSYYSELNLDTPMVNFNGALCHMPEDSNWTSYYHKTLDLDLAMDLFQHREKLGVDFMLMEGKEQLYASCKTLPPSPYIPADTLSTYLHPSGRLEENPTAVSLFMPAEKQEMIRQRILNRYGADRVSVRTWGGQMPCLEIVHAGVQKALGVETAARSYGIDRSDILAFGDEDNDFEMLSYVGWGVAMKNGIPTIKAIADDITSHTNAQDGVARYLEEYFDLKIAQK